MDAELTNLSLKVRDIRKEFPILSEKVYDQPFIFLDSAASAQKPQAVIDDMVYTMRHRYANIHRGLYWMSEETTQAYEMARQTVANFLGASTRQEIVFTRNSTEAINLVAHAYGTLIKPGQTVLISAMEHHANLVPWQLLCQRKNIHLKIVPIDEQGELRMDVYEALLKDNDVALVAMTHMSNVLGTMTDAKTIASHAHQYGARVLFDGSQYAVHKKVDVQDIGADFYVITGHKLYGPTGIGALWARAELLEDMPPFMGGGDMISTVTFEASTWADVPYKFEAGTPPIIEAIGFARAIAWIEDKGFEFIERYDSRLTQYARQKLSEVEGIKIFGHPENSAAVLSFVIEGTHPHDISTLLDKGGIAIRAGHHCAEPLMKILGVSSTSRASLGIYTLPEEIDQLAQQLKVIRQFLT